MLNSIKKATSFHEYYEEWIQVYRYIDKVKRTAPKARITIPTRTLFPMRLLLRINHPAVSYSQMPFLGFHFVFSIPSSSGHTKAFIQSIASDMDI